MRKYIIWDLDGTLLYSLDDLWLAVNHTLRMFEMPERSIDEVRCFVGNGVRKLMERSVPENTDSRRFETCFAEFKDYYKKHCKDNTRLYEGIENTLKTLRDCGCHMAIVSNKLQVGVDELYEEWFADTVDVAIGEREGIDRKPAADMVNLAIRELEDMLNTSIGKEDCVYIGDSDVDIATAKNAMIPCISVLWGFRDEDFLRNHGAMTFASSPEDIIKIIQHSRI